MSPRISPGSRRGLRRSVATDARCDLHANRRPHAEITVDITFPWALAVPGIIFLVVIAPLWIIFHYITVWKRMRGRDLRPGQGRHRPRRARADAQAGPAARDADRIPGDDSRCGSTGVERAMSGRHPHGRRRRRRGPVKRVVRGLADAFGVPRGRGDRGVRGRVRIHSVAVSAGVPGGVVLGERSRAHAPTRGFILRRSQAWKRSALARNCGTETQGRRCRTGT